MTKKIVMGGLYEALSDDDSFPQGGHFIITGKGWRNGRVLTYPAVHSAVPEYEEHPVPCDVVQGELGKRLA